QAEDGIRDRTVTGVQTCALPISAGLLPGAFVIHATTPESVEQEIVAFDVSTPERFVEQEADAQVMGRMVVKSVMIAHGPSQLLRSEERRVGKEGRSSWSRDY